MIFIYFVHILTMYYVIGSYTVLVEVTRDSQILSIASVTEHSWVAVGLILKSKGKGQLFLER